MTAPGCSIASKAVTTCTTRHPVGRSPPAPRAGDGRRGSCPTTPRPSATGSPTRCAPSASRAGHSRPYHPQTCGKVERFHHTLKRCLAAQAPAATLAELQAQLDTFRRIYNHHRPHQSLNRQFPADVWHRHPQERTRQPTPHHPHHASTTAPSQPTASSPSADRYLISIGVAHNDHPATRRSHRHHAATSSSTADSPAALTINPTRHHQPIHPRPGRPPRIP